MTGEDFPFRQYQEAKEKRKAHEAAWRMMTRTER